MKAKKQRRPRSRCGLPQWARRRQLAIERLELRTVFNAAPTDIALSSVTVAENQPSGIAVGTLSTTDPDASDTFNYSLVAGTGDTDNASFAIVGSELRTANSFNYETKNRYSVRLRSTDAGGLSTDRSFSITVSMTAMRFVDVGDSGNIADSNTSFAYGAVDYAYKIGKYDVTIGQYAAFLNAVAATDTYGLYRSQMATDLNIAGIARSGSSGSYTYSVIDNDGTSANRPITYVSWFDAARFANWISNGQPTGLQNSATTERGAYQLDGATTGNAVARSATNPNTGAAPAFFLPTENEWYKAAYYSPLLNSGAGGYYRFTQSNTAPGNAIGSTANQANYLATVNGASVYSVTQSVTYSTGQNYLTDVGAFAGSASYYGTFDQLGNVRQWNDLDGLAGSARGNRGGSWSAPSSGLWSSARGTPVTTTESSSLGFRLAGTANSPPGIVISAASVAENRPAGTAVGTLSTVLPLGGSAFTYSLVSGSGSTDNASFEISGNTLRTTVVLDAESKSNYSVRVRATSPGGLSTEKSLTIGITNVNEFRPMFSGQLVTVGTSRVSTDSVGGQANGESSAPVYSPDGTKIAFVSSASNLVTGDTNGCADVFVKDLVTGAISRVSVDAAGSQGNGASVDPITNSSFPMFSPDGTKLAFVSTASNLVVGDTNGSVDVFVKDLATGAITRVSTDATGAQANADALAPSFGPDGTKVAFVSLASNLVSGDTNGIWDVFVKDLVTDAITRVSTDASGNQGNDASQNRWPRAPAFSPDGTKLAFWSRASNFVAGDTNLVADVFIKDLVTGVIARVSTDADGIQANGTADALVFSPDGKKIAFVSEASNLVANDTNAAADVFVKDLVTGAIARVSIDALGGQAMGNSLWPVFSPDGTKIVFESLAANLVAGDTNTASDVFVKDLGTGAITRISTDASRGQGNFGSSSPAIGPDGTQVAFISSASNLVTGDTNAVTDVFVASLGFILSVAENTESIGVLSATDRDTGASLTYGLSGTDAAFFTIDGTGALRFRVAPDFDLPSDQGANNIYDLVVNVSDGQYVTSAPVAVTVTNVNESPTDIALSMASVAENQSSGTTVGTLSTTDPDAGGWQNYLLVSGAGSTDNASFTIVGNELRTAASFNFEVARSFSVRVRATDQGGLALEKVFTVTVTNVNEAPTDIALSATSIAENQPSGATVGTLSTTDPDTGNTVTYTLVPGEGDTSNVKFTIVGGELRTAASFNFEDAQNSCSVRVRARDQDGLSLEKIFTITVTNVNEAPTDIALSPVSIAENASANAVIGTLSTADPDESDTVTYTLVYGFGDADNGAFNISGNKLRATSSLNFEAKSSCAVRVRSTDQGGLFTEKAFTITVTNVNEAPADIALSAASIPENQPPGAAVGDFSTADPDASSIFTYTLVSGDGSTDNGSFAIDGESLMTAASFNFESKSSYSVRVRSTDQGALSIEKVFTITVTNVNEAPTDVALSPVSTAENAGANAVVGTLSTTDADENGLLTYMLVSGVGDVDNGAFNISGSQLRAASSLNFEAKSSYTFRVRSTDQDGLSTEKTFTITVTNVNEAPTDLALSASTVAENQVSGSAVGTFSTADPDASSIFTYTLVSGDGSTDNGSFAIDGESLKTAASFNFESKSSYLVRVRSTDQGGLWTEKSFTITVTNVAEQPVAPQISIPAFLPVIEDVASPLLFVAPAFTDRDSPLSKTITVRLTVPDGTISAVSLAGVTVGGIPTSRTFTGSIAAMNDYFAFSPARIRYTTSLNNAVARTLMTTVYESYGSTVLTSSRSATLSIAPVNDAPVVAVPTSFTVTEDTRGNLVWPITMTPFADVDSTALVITLAVPDGSISAVSTTAVTVGGTPTSRTFAGTASNLNAFFKRIGAIGYTPLLDSTSARTLITTISDGLLSSSAASSIAITPVNDAPTITAAATLRGAVVATPFEITYDTLRSAVNLVDVDHSSPSLIIRGVNAGTVQKWDGSKWVIVFTSGFSGLAQRTLSPGQKIRWIPPVGASGVRAAFKVQAWDGFLRSATTAQISVDFS